MSKGKPYVDIRGYHQGVTGSCIRNTVHFSDGEKFRFLVDFGMYQGEGHQGIEYNDSVNPEKIDAILLTHTHLDHDGALPIFVRKGYNKKIYMSDASACVIDIGLSDSYNIMKRDAKIKKQPILFSESDIERTMKQIEAVKYEQTIKIHDNISVTFFNNGHLIGASVILVQIDEPGGIINLLYTGDYKSTNVFLDIKPFPFWVYALPNLTIIAEATYGSTNSWDIEHPWEDDIVEACSRNQLIFNCAFGQGRAQELMYYIRKLEDEGKIPKDYPVKIDGTTAIDYTFRYLDRSNIIHMKEESKNFFPYNIQFVDNKSRPALLNIKERAIFIATSGMGSHGPAATYIPHFLSNPNALIYIPGYASEGTLARKIVEADYGEEILFKDGNSVIKKAEVKQTGQFSGHITADQEIAFFEQFSPLSILFNHGEIKKRQILEKRTQQELGISDRKTGNLGMGYVYRVNSYGIDKAVEK